MKTHVLVALVALFMNQVSLSVAGSLNTPNGNPTPIPASYSNYSPSTSLFVNLLPSPAQFMPQGNCPWILLALAAQGFAQADANNPRGYSGANGWTINFASL